MRIKRQYGFTLIELSIVLVIVALVIGGVVAGRQLIINSQLQAQVTQLQRFDMATNNFRLKYNSLPADSSTMVTTPYSGGAVYGDGDGKFDAHATLNNYQGDETMYFFIALSNYNFVPEQYTACNGSFNCAGTGTWSGLINTWPETKIAPGYGMTIVGGKSGGLYYFLGVDTSASGGCCMAYYHGMSQAGTIPPALAYGLDTKLDDGDPTGGRVYASTNFQTANSTCNHAACAAYTDPTVMQLAPGNNTCVTAADYYNVSAQNTAANRCRVVVKSAVIGAD